MWLLTGWDGCHIQVHSVVSKMMMEEAFAGSWDQPTRSVVMHNAQPSRLQTLASELSDRAAGGHLHRAEHRTLIDALAHSRGRHLPTR